MASSIGITIFLLSIWLLSTWARIGIDAGQQFSSCRCFKCTSLERTQERSIASATPAQRSCTCVAHSAAVLMGAEEALVALKHLPHRSKQLGCHQASSLSAQSSCFSVCRALQLLQQSAGGTIANRFPQGARLQPGIQQDCYHIDQQLLCRAGHRVSKLLLDKRHVAISSTGCVTCTGTDLASCPARIPTLCPVSEATPESLDESAL